MLSACACVNVNVQLEGETLWLNAQQMAELFDRDSKTIRKHIKNVFEEGELSPISTVAKFATVEIEGYRQVERNVEYYTLDVVISVGYRDAEASFELMDFILNPDEDTLSASDNVKNVAVNV